MKKVTAEISDRILRSNVEVHRLEAESYDKVHSEIFGPYEQRQTNRDIGIIESHLPKGRAHYAMDVGCGTGNITLKLLNRGYHVRAVDISAEMLEQLRLKVPKGVSEHIIYEQADAVAAIAGSGFNAQLDLISFSSVLHHLPDYLAVLSSALVLLRPGGIIWICHEPLSVRQGSRSIGATICSHAIGILDIAYIYTRKTLVHLTSVIQDFRLPRRIDHSFSDYHARDGISVPAVRDLLDSKDAEIVFFETYTSRYSSILAFYDARFGLSVHQHFRMIARIGSKT
jgi:2-polyprenyl-3-methyl-5-hydroxy-6-metoxy-1,4-benzoquinol methylase